MPKGHFFSSRHTEGSVFLILGQSAAVVVAVIVVVDFVASPFPSDLFLFWKRQAPSATNSIDQVWQLPVPTCYPRPCSGIPYLFIGAFAELHYLDKKYG
jgi:hypothetical protein